MTTLPSQFLVFNHDGIFRATISLESVYQIDSLLARFAKEKTSVWRDVADHPYGLMHLATFSGEAARRMPILELTKGFMTLATAYSEVKSGAESWVSPHFDNDTGECFALRCAFDFGLWAAAGLRLFLGLNPGVRTHQLWLYYAGQIYRPPFGNIFEATCQLCLGHNENSIGHIFKPRQPDSVALTQSMELLSNSLWNRDTFNLKYLPILDQNVRFDSSKSTLPMLPPLAPDLVKGCGVAANKDLAFITSALV